MLFLHRGARILHPFTKTPQKRSTKYNGLIFKYIMVLHSPTQDYAYEESSVDHHAERVFIPGAASSAAENTEHAPVVSGWCGGRVGV